MQWLQLLVGFGELRGQVRDLQLRAGQLDADLRDLQTQLQHVERRLWLIVVAAAALGGAGGWLGALAAGGA